MKKIKVNKNFVDIKGMALLEFIITVIVVCVVVAIFIEGGYYMKAEAALIGFNRVAAREVSTTGGLSNNSAQMYADKLRQEGIKNVQIKLFDLSNGSNAPVINYQNGQYSNSLSGGTMGFRRNFKLVVQGQHALNAVSLIGSSNVISAPVVFGVNGKIEKFKPE